MGGGVVFLVFSCVELDYFVPLPRLRSGNSSHYEKNRVPYSTDCHVAGIPLQRLRRGSFHDADGTGSGVLLHG